MWYVMLKGSLRKPLGLPMGLQELQAALSHQITEFLLSYFLSLKENLTELYNIVRSTGYYLSSYFTV